MRYIFLILFSINNLVTNAQCNEIQIGIRSQADVDQFITESMGCDSIKYLSILAKSPIYNLDSLYKLKYVKELQLDNYGPGMDTKGLRNLEEVDYLWIHVYKGMDTLNSLRRVGRLDIDFPINDTTLDLAIFNKLSFIEDLNIKNTSSLNGIGEFSSNTNFHLTLLNNMKTNIISKILPVNQLSIDRLEIIDCSNFELDNFRNINSIGGIFLKNNTNMDFRPFQAINKLNSLALYNIIGNENVIFGDAFYKIDTLDRLNIRENKNHINFYDLIPNLRHVNGVINFVDNTGVIDLSFFRNFKPVKGVGPFPLYYSYLELSNNTNIKGCNNSFICKTARMYPDSVQIAGNTDGCNLEEILEYCITSTDELEKESTTIYPNPTSGMIYLMGSRIERVEVINQIGRLVFNGASTTIDLTNQPNGLYLLRLHKKDGTIQTGKVIKI